MAEQIAKYQDDPEFITHGILDDVTDVLCGEMDARGISRAELARKMGVSRAYVTRFLNTPLNTRVETIVRFAQAVGLDVKVELVDKSAPAARSGPARSTPSTGVQPSGRSRSAWWGIWRRISYERQTEQRSARSRASIKETGSMSLARLQLLEYRLETLIVEFNEDWLEAAEAGEAEEHSETYNVEAKVAFYSDKDAEGKAAIRLLVNCTPQTGLCRFRQVKVALWGIFIADSTLDEDERARYFGLDGPSILHGLARGIVASATGGCVEGPFIIPALNFAEILAAQAAEEDGEEVDE